MLMTKNLHEYDFQDLGKPIQQKIQKVFLNILMAEYCEKYDSEYLGVDKPDPLQKKIQKYF